MIQIDHNGAYVRDLLKFVMYAGAIISIVAFALPYWDNKPGGVSIPIEYNRYLTWGGLAMVLIGYFGRRVTDPEDY